MLVNVTISRVDTNRVQIKVAKPQGKGTPAQMYASSEAAPGVLLEFGLEKKEIDETLNLLREANPREPLTFSVRNIPQNILSKHGFQLA
jgi:hypothetical protein